MPGAQVRPYGSWRSPQSAAQAVAAVKENIPTLIEIDCDGHRAGVKPGSPQLVEIARQLARGAQPRGVRPDPIHRRENALADRAVHRRLRIDIDAVEAESARLKAIEGIDQVVVLQRLNRSLDHQIPAQGL